MERNPYRDFSVSKLEQDTGWENLPATKPGRFWYFLSRLEELVDQNAPGAEELLMKVFSLVSIQLGLSLRLSQLLDYFANLEENQGGNGHKPRLSKWLFSKEKFRD